MNKAEKKRADQALKFLLVMRDVAEADGNIERAEMIDGFVRALKTGSDHPILTNWLLTQSDSELAKQHRQCLADWQKDERAKRYLQMLDGLIKE